MARTKKNKEIDFGFTPSKYQQKIFDFVRYGVGNAMIVARAGAAKTTTAISAMKLIPNKQKCLFIAFNKSIAEELSEKLKNNTNVTVRTSHSLGFWIVRRNLGSNIEVDEYKYRTYIKSHINELSTAQDWITTKRELTEYMDSILLLINFARFNYCQSVKEIDNVAKKYAIPIQFDECEVVLKAMKWGKEHTETIDYTDMVWLPVELKMKPLGLQFDWVMVDEAQDLSIVAIELFKKCIKRGGRFIAVADDFQTIYTFSGASEDAFNLIKDQPNTQIFELPISYRCDKNIIKYAQNIVTDIQHRDNADEGEIIEDCYINCLEENDMVLSRTKAPLVKLYTKLLRKGVNCYIKGQDIGGNLIKLIEHYDIDELNANLKKDGVFVKLYQKLFNDRNKLMEKRGLDFDDATLSSSIMEQYDNINTLMTLAEKINSKEKLINHIKSVFAEEKKGICLSTIHKAKGLEANNVYILCHSMMPSKLATQNWEKIQERNLSYVAYTRAKHKLGFISEKEVPPCGSSQEPLEIINDLMFIENKICKLLGTEPTKRMSNVDIAKFSLNSAVDMSKPLVHIKTINSSNSKETDTLEMLALLSEQVLKDIDKMDDDERNNLFEILEHDTDINIIEKH